jgi:iron-sulfur cluster assembly protein
MAVTVSETAAREIHTIIKDQELDPEKIRLRVGVKGGGCSGFSYLLDLTESQKETDEMWEFTYPVAAASSKSANESGSDTGGGVAVAQQGDTFTLRVICDPKSYLYLNNTVIDFRDELMGRGFVFNNPNATSSCGCGSSFSA